MMVNGEGYMFFGGGLMWIFWLLVLVIIVALVTGLIRSGTGANSSRNDSPADILKRRLASGEIDQDEYDRLRKELNK